MLLQGVQAAPPAREESPPPSFPARIVQVFTAPAAAGEALARQPRVLGAILACAALGVVSAALLYYTDAGRAVVLEQVKESLRQSGQPESNASGVAAAVGFIAPVAAIGAAVGTALLLLVLAGGLWVIFSGALGTGLGFRQHLALASHAWLIMGLGGVLTVALMLARGSVHAT